MGNNIKDRIEDVKEWISEHTKIVMPAVLLVCVLITVIVALNANKKAAEEVEAQAAEIIEVEQQPVENVEEVPKIALEKNAYPAVNALMSDYYAALANGDIEAVSAMNSYVEDTEKIRIQEMSKYIDTYPELEVYTKNGPVENSYLVYVYSKVKFTEYDKLVPGMQAFYVCTDENGSCYINEGEDNSVVTNYIRDISLQDDVVDLNNKVAVEYNELLESDEELTAFLADLSGRIDVSVGEALAKAEAVSSQENMEENAEATASENEQDTEAADEAEASEETATEEQDHAGKTVRATDVVNVRSSDSETADKIGRAMIGDEFTLLEEKGNGWSKITYEDGEAFIKSEFLEVIEEEVEEEGAQTEGTESENEESQSTTASDSNGETVTVKESVNIRKSASETGEKLGLAYEGEKLELLMKQADGWTKVKYKGQTAYVKSEFVE